MAVSLSFGPAITLNNLSLKALASVTPLRFGYALIVRRLLKNPGVIFFAVRDREEERLPGNNPGLVAVQPFPKQLIP